MDVRIATVILLGALTVLPSVRSEVSLTFRLAGGLCRQYKTWKTTKEVQPPLKSKSPQAKSGPSGCDLLERVDGCDSEDCRPFSCAGGGQSDQSPSGMRRLEKGTVSYPARPTPPPPALPPPATAPPPPPPPPEKPPAPPSTNQGPPPNSPGSPYGNPNNPNNLTVPACTSTDNPYNNWPNPPPPGPDKQRRSAGGTHPNQIEVEADDYIEDDQGLRSYLKEVYGGPAAKVIGGGNASDNLFPYAARIAFVEKKCYWDHTVQDQNRRFSRRSNSWYELRRCTGIIFNQYYVLTSGQCCQWLSRYRVAWSNPNISYPQFNCSSNDPFCPRVPEPYEHLVNISDIFLYFGEFNYETGMQRNRERRSMRSLGTDCYWNPSELFDRESICLVELFARIIYKQPSFYPLLVPNEARSDKNGQKEGKPFKSTNGEVRALFIGWGNTNGDKLEWTNYLKYIRLKIIPSTSTQCRDARLRLGYSNEDANQLLCAELYKKEKKNALCRGDVGGPLICETESGHERLCGVLAGFYRRRDNTYPDDVLCQDGDQTYVFINLVDVSIQRSLFQKLGSVKGAAFGYVYRNNRSNWQDELSSNIVRNSAFRRKFSVPWDTLT